MSPTKMRRISLDEPYSEHREKFKEEMERLLEELDEMYADNLRVGDLRKLMAYTPSSNLREKLQVIDIIAIMDDVGLNTSTAKSLLEKAIPEQKDEDFNFMHKKKKTARRR